MSDMRNAFGYPTAYKLEKARQYAAAAKERNKPPSECEQCRIKEFESAVIQIAANWSKQ